jgi:hypothetical protein
VFAEYKRLIKSNNLKEFSVTGSTKICGKHFPKGERACRTQLPTIFPWSQPLKRRREIIKYDFPLGSKTIKDNSSTALPKDQVVLCTDDTIFPELNLNDSVINQKNSDLDNKDEKELVSTKVQTEQFDLHDSCKQEAEKLKEEVNLLQNELVKFEYKLEYEPKFNIDAYKDCDEDISFFTEFPNYSSMVMFF